MFLQNVQEEGSGRTVAVAQREEFALGLCHRTESQVFLVVLRRLRVFALPAQILGVESQGRSKARRKYR